MSPVCGIDPGKKGAIAFAYDDDYIDVHDMPVIGKNINGYAIADLFTEFKPQTIYLEKVNSFGMGRQSAYNFGQGNGVIQGVAAALKITLIEFTPQQWKKHYSLNSDKSASRLMASRLFPAHSHLFVRVKDDGRAESALIANYGKLKEPNLT